MQVKHSAARDSSTGGTETVAAQGWRPTLVTDAPFLCSFASSFFFFSLFFFVFSTP